MGGDGGRGGVGVCVRDHAIVNFKSVKEGEDHINSCRQNREVKTQWNVKKRRIECKQNTSRM